MAKKFFPIMLYTLWQTGGMVMPFMGCSSSLHAEKASFRLEKSPFGDCESCNTPDSPDCKPEDCRDWWASVDFILNGEKKHGREEIDQNGFTVNDVPVGAEISLGPVGTLKNYTPGEKVCAGVNIFKCSGSFMMNCGPKTSGDFTCKCWRISPCLVAPITPSLAPIGPST
jgi:hypothetical protein